MRVATLLALMVTGAMVIAPRALATTWDAAAQFDEVLPNGLPAVQSGPWRYGSTPSLSTGYSLTLFDYMDQNPGIDHWRDYKTGTDVPAVLYNQTAADGWFGQTVSPHTMAMHPGPNDNKAIVRWTAVEGGTYTISTSFWTLGNATTDGNVLVDGTTLFADFVDSVHTMQSFSTTTYLAAGSTVDFALGYGENQNYTSDCTMFAATISTTVPEPASSLTLGSALAGLTLAALRRPDKPSPTK